MSHSSIQGDALANVAVAAEAAVEVVPRTRRSEDLCDPPGGGAQHRHDSVTFDLEAVAAAGADADAGGAASCCPRNQALDRLLQVPGRCGDLRGLYLHVSENDFVEECDRKWKSAS